MYFQEPKVRVQFSEAFRLKVLDEIRKKHYTVAEAGSVSKGGVNW